MKNKLTTQEIAYVFEALGRLNMIQSDSETYASAYDALIELCEDYMNNEALRNFCFYMSELHYNARYCNSDNTNIIGNVLAIILKTVAIGPIK